jgi:hypothetical protein
MKVKKEKSKSLKALQSELLDLITKKHYDTDPEIKEYVDKISTKRKALEIKAEQRKLKKASLGEKVKVLFCKVSFETLKLCNKLIVKERVSNKIMDYPISDQLKQAESEIFEELNKCAK